MKIWKRRCTCACLQGMSSRGPMVKNLYANSKSSFMSLNKPPGNGSTNYLVSSSFKASLNPSQMFTKLNGCSFTILLVYVDDIIIIGDDVIYIDQFKKVLDQWFKLKDLKTLKFFLGLEVARNNTGILILQSFRSLGRCRILGC